MEVVAYGDVAERQPLPLRRTLFLALCRNRVGELSYAPKSAAGYVTFGAQMRWGAGGTTLDTAQTMLRLHIPMR